MSEFKGVEDTLFIPLTARINISKKFPNYFYDEKAIQLEKILPKNNSIEEKSDEYSMIASAARYYNLDEISHNFISKHKNANIINLGVGLETSYFRIDRRDSIFYEIDLPDVIESRKQVLGENEGEILIPGDLFDLEWTKNIDCSKPSLMIVSGVFQYFHEDEIIKLIDGLKEKFDGGEIVFDATTKFGLKLANRYVKRTGNESAMMYFYVNDSKKFANKTNCQLIEERPFFREARNKLSKKLEFITKISMYFADKFKQTKIIHLKL